MKIKYIYRSLAILFSLFLYAQSTSAMTLTASPNPAAMNKTITFKIKLTIAAGPCNVHINFGDGRAALLVGTTNQTETTFQTTHTYAQAGVYTVFAYSDCVNVAPPNPVYLSLRISDFEITKIETLFETGKPQVTLDRNAPAPGLYAKINFSGSGFLKGYWEIDGKIDQYFFKQLSIGPQAMIEYPKIPGLKTFKSGSHIVRFVVTQPTLDITFPSVVYYVTEKSALHMFNIDILNPGPHMVLPFEPLTVNWKELPSTEVYMVHIYSLDSDIPVFSAYAKKSSYIIRPEILKGYLTAGKSYIIQIQGYHEDTRLTGQSKKLHIRFK